jgi:anaerobic dimethyl sulfoxide reductase subunit B (iron-sulfur subunit)
MACKDKHDLELGVLWRRVYEVTGGEWKKKGAVWTAGVFAYNLSIACNHCEKPICQTICPAGAISKREDGIVLIDRSKCIGCRYCEWACPYGSPQYDRVTGTMSKCHFCYDFIERGKDPACVVACPMRALDFGDFSGLKERYQGSSQIYPLPRSSLTSPAVIIRPHRNAARAEKEKGRIANREEV